MDYVLVTKTLALNISQPHEHGPYRPLALRIVCSPPQRAVRRTARWLGAIFLIRFVQLLPQTIVNRNEFKKKRMPSVRYVRVLQIYSSVVH